MNVVLGTIPATAKACGIHPRHLRKAVRDNQVPAFRVGAWLRVREEDVQRWLDTLRYVPP
ncbi:MAG: helix-turn-helix domain-containing protein [bacterium]|nr:helix-turn-helix domain-containing protein [bacterium]